MYVESEGEEGGRMRIRGDGGVMSTACGMVYTLIPSADFPCVNLLRSDSDLRGERVARTAKVYTTDML